MGLSIVSRDGWIGHNDSEIGHQAVILKMLAKQGSAGMSAARLAAVLVEIRSAVVSISWTSSVPLDSFNRNSHRLKNCWHRREGALRPWPA